MAEPFVMDTDLSRGSRLVWILNRNDLPYTEKFKDVEITIPPNHKKEVKMTYLEARQFLGQGKPPAKQDANGKWINGILPKALYTVDLTKDEEKGTVNEIIKKNVEEAEKSTAFKCMVCAKQFPNDYALKVHVANMHEGAVAAAPNEG